MTTIRFASHIHSICSDDSSWTLPRLARILGRAGYDGALICDHDRTMTIHSWDHLRTECARVSESTGFILVPGVEYQDDEHVVHLPVFGDVPFYGRSPRIAAVLESAADDGGAAVFAHPARRNASDRFDPGWAPLLSGIEVWSRKYDGLRPNRWALDTAAQHALTAFVSLDFHGPRQLYPLAMLVETPSSADQRDVVAALLDGRCRASALGLRPERYGSGLLGVAGSAFESTRRWAAPRVRRVEAALSQRQGGAHD
jgi:predicted metal-dependent phosphoesterase TrpH